MKTQIPPTKFTAWVYSEDYCCPYGYLELCRARKETPKGMADFSGIPLGVIWARYRDVQDGKITCARKKDCMKPLIDSLKA